MWGGGGDCGGRKGDGSNAWAYTTTAHMRGVSLSLCLSLSLILTLSVYVIPAPPYSNAIPAHFHFYLSLKPLFFLLFSNNNPRSLCSQSRYTRLFTFKIYEVINTSNKEEYIQTVTEWHSGTEVKCKIWEHDLHPDDLASLKANGLQIPLPCADNKTYLARPWHLTWLAAYVFFISAVHGKFKFVKKLSCV